MSLPEEQIPEAEPEKPAIPKGWGEARFQGEVEMREGGSLDELNIQLNKEKGIRPAKDNKELFGSPIPIKKPHNLEDAMDFVPVVETPEGLKMDLSALEKENDGRYSKIMDRYSKNPSPRYFKGSPGSTLPGRGNVTCQKDGETWLYPIQLDTINACIEELQQMMFELDSKNGLINFKKDDESELTCIAIRIYPRNKPMDWSFLDPRTWFKSDGKSKDA